MMDVRRHLLDGKGKTKTKQKKTVRWIGRKVKRNTHEDVAVMMLGCLQRSEMKYIREFPEEVSGETIMGDAPCARQNWCK